MIMAIWYSLDALGAGQVPGRYDPTPLWFWECSPNMMEIDGKNQFLSCSQSYAQLEYNRSTQDVTPR